MRSKKKVYNLWTLLVVVAMLVSGCSSSEPDCTKPENFCVGLVTDLGEIDDNSFNQLAWEGLKQAESDLGAYVQYIETVDLDDFDKNIDSFANAGYDVIVTVGFGQKQVTTDAAMKYSTIKFIGVEQTQNPDKSLPRNLTGLIFPEDQAGFLAGALAAQMTESNKIGAVCGPPWLPSAMGYCEGFRAGAAYIDPDLQVSIAYNNNIGFNDSPFDPLWDEITANALINNDVDVIFGAAGYEENAAVTAAAQRGVYAIGVNTDQYLTLREARAILLSSAIKLITTGVFDLIKAARDGNFPGGNWMGQIGYAPYHDLDSQIPAEVKAEMVQIQEGLADGSIETELLPSETEPAPSETEPVPSETEVVPLETETVPSEP
jgi:basic membrane protein A and related proteins